MVETAFTLVLLVMLLIGVTTAGIAYGQANALQTAAREGARFGATLPWDGSWLTTVRDVTREAATGSLDSGVPGRYICVANIGPDRNERHFEGASSPSVANGCFDDGRPASEQRVQVVVERSATINAVVFSTDVTLDSTSAARYER